MGKSEKLFYHSVMSRALLLKRKGERMINQDHYQPHNDSQSSVALNEGKTEW
jgi:hypothetical protein